MYSLMIAEDELATRRGLVNMVNWESLGFRVTADFADGKELLERLGNYSMLPDVILTDIQMIQVSGLDIAKYVADNGLPVKVVLLTGYKLFEYAQAAIENHVASYLLKPVSITNLKQVFSGLKEQLDREKDKKEYKEKMSRYYNRLVNYEKQKYILDAYYGMLSDKDKAASRLALLEPGDENAGKRMVLYLMKVIVVRNEEYDAFIRNFGVQELEEQLMNAMTSVSEEMEYYPIYWDCRPIHQGDISFLGIFWQKKEGGSISFRELQNMVTGMVSGMLSITCKAEVMDKLQPLELAGYFAAIGHSEKRETLMREAEYNQLLKNQRKLIFQYICQEDEEQLEEIASAFVESALRCGVVFARNQCVKVLGNIIERLTEGNLEEEERLTAACTPNSVYTENTFEHLEKWLMLRLHRLAEYYSARSRFKQGSSIDKIKEYIGKNFCKDITLSDVAGACYLNPVYVSRLMKEQTGDTFTEYVTKLRMEKAVELLESTDKYVYEVAEESGYQNLKYFYKVFKRITGRSPNDFRPDQKEKGYEEI